MILDFGIRILDWASQKTYVKRQMSEIRIQNLELGSRNTEVRVKAKNKSRN